MEKKGRFSKLIVTLVVILNILFTAAVLYILFYRMVAGNERFTIDSNVEPFLL